MSWHLAHRETYVIDKSVANLKPPVSFQPGYRFVVTAMPVSGLGRNERTLGKLRQLLTIPGLGEVKGDEYTLTAFSQLFVPSSEFTFELLFQPLPRLYSLELAFWVDTVPLISGTGQSGNITLDLTAVEAALTAIGSQLTTVETSQGVTSSALAAVQAELVSFDNVQAALTNQVAALSESEQTANNQLLQQLAAVLVAVAPPAVKTLTFETSGDTNGVFYWLGTFYGFHAWANPFSLGMLKTIISSNPTSKSLALLSDRLSGVEFYTNDSPGEWIAFDLGVGNRLLLNAYSLKHDNEVGYYLRNWRLQGSNNVEVNTFAGVQAATWVDLKTHSSDTTINAPEAWGNWTVSGVTVGYRWLRVLATDTDSNGSRYLVLGEVEFYGAFTRKALNS